MEEKVCKKCGKVLPPDYKKKICESCENKRVDRIKKIGSTVLSICVGIGSVVAGVAGLNNKGPKE